MIGRRGLALAALAAMAWGHPAAAARDDEAALRAVDERQRALVARGDVEGLAALAHPDLRINAPTGRVLTRATFLSEMRSGGIAAEAFERTAESVTIAGAVGVVMGRETFTPTATSELGRAYGAVPLSRRYTNVYLRERGGWRWLARHANVVASAR